MQRPAWKISVVSLSRPLIPWMVLAAFALVLLPPAGATEVKIYRSGGTSELEEGELEGVRLDRYGRLLLAQRLEREGSIDEPFVHALAVTSDGAWILGTGSDGKVLRLGADGTVETLLDTPEAEVFAVLVAADGTIYAGTSPEGKVYRIGSGETTPESPPESSAESAESFLFFDPQELYIWDLALDAEGRLLVATGTSGKLYAVDAQGQGEVLYDSEDTHLRTLHRQADGALLMGTAGQGLVLRRNAGARPRVETLYDAPQPEIVALAAAPDGTIYVAAVASEGSLVDLSEVAASSADDDDEPDAGDDGNSEDAFAGVGTRPSGFGAGRSEILALRPDGDAETLTSFKEETVYSLLWLGDRLWIGTGMEGQLATWTDRGLVLEKELEERQVVALLGQPGAPGPQVATTNGGAVYRFADGLEPEGTYTSKVLDADQTTRLGSLRWRGRTGEGSLRLAVRSGVSAAPDASWSAWTELEAPAPLERRAQRRGRGGAGQDPGGAPQAAGLAGTEASLAGVPQGRYFQWRATFLAPSGDTPSGDAISPRLDSVEISYRHRNLAPKISQFDVMDPGQILVPSNFNPSSQVYEPAYPSRDGMFTSLSTSDQKGEGRLKPLWKLGYRALRWSAADANKDSLRYQLAFRVGEGTEEDLTEGARDDETSDGSRKDPWLSIVEDLEDSHYNFDATALPDGVYRFRVSASDADDNIVGEGLSTEQVSAPVVIDHSPPRLVAGRPAAGRPAGHLEVVIEDAWNPLREASFSVDAGPWTSAVAGDGLVDGRRETLILEVPAGARLTLLKVMDAAYNVVTFDLSREQ